VGSGDNQRGMAGGQSDGGGAADAVRKQDRVIFFRLNPVNFSLECRAQFFWGVVQALAEQPDGDSVRRAGCGQVDAAGQGFTGQGEVVGHFIIM